MTLFQKIDSFFESRKKSEKNIIFLTILLALGAISYQYIIPWSQKQLQHAKERKSAIEEKINLDKAYLRAMSVNGDRNYYIKKYSADLQHLHTIFLQINDKKNYLEHKIKELSYLLYNKKRWAHFLDSLALKAARHKVEIDAISNRFLDITKNFGHVLEIEISCNGAYKNLIGYINSIEQSDLVVDVYQIKMVGSNPINTTFKVSVWGINY